MKQGEKLLLSKKKSSLLPSKPIELTYGEVKIKAMAWPAWKADMV
jgi:hypothetical protein